MKLTELAKQWEAVRVIVNELPADELEQLARYLNEQHPSDILESWLMEEGGDKDVGRQETAEV